MKIINSDAFEIVGDHAFVMTDPPFELPGERLAVLLEKLNVQHAVLLLSMHQAIDFFKHSKFTLGFDFVFNQVVPKKSKSDHQPHYTHATGIYARKGKGIFSRRMRIRSDSYDSNYWPTIFNAPRDMGNNHSHAKNQNAITDLLGNFDTKTVLDPFAGGGSVGWAAHELALDCTLCEIDKQAADALKKSFSFFSKD